MASTFTKIVQGEIPCYKIAEDERFLAFLDIRPIAKGHTLVIPKEEVDYLFDLDDEAMAGLMVFAKRVAVALKTTIPCFKVGVLVIGDEVPHAHVHLVPFEEASDLLFNNAPKQFTPEEMIATAGAVATNFV